MKFARALFPIAFILIASCADDHKKVEVPINAEALSNGSGVRKVAPAPAVAPSSDIPVKTGIQSNKQDRVPMQRVIIIRSREQVEGVEFTNDLYIPPKAQPFVKTTQLTPRPASVKQSELIITPIPAATKHKARPAPVPVPAPAPALAAGKPKPRPAPVTTGAKKSQITFLASVIYHKDGQADVSVRDKAAIAEVAGFMLGKDGQARVYGHASAATRGLKPEAAKKANFEVSKKRALTVRRELIANKVPAEKVRAFAVGDLRPAVPETSPKAEATNRRTEIFVRF